ncbi:MAG: HAMP domain-containing protein [Desulfobacterales bacterium]|nr:HAMP domain-containing protein [Desulfobacterales bacterium]MBI5897534.1 HAMP domain-containing protein [Desulfobacterales bacterium]
MSKRIAAKVSLYVNLVLLVVLAIGSFYLIMKQSAALEAQLLERGKTESIVGARMTGALIEEAVDNGVFTVTDAFDTAYESIPDFNPPKFHTKYDFYLDKALLGIEDEFLKDESVVFAVAVDINGYLPTHNTRFNAPPTGNRERDLTLNRSKRIFADPVGIAAAKNTAPGFLQVYKRDTGEIMWDISSPIFVKGKHWGGFRIGFSLERITAAKTHMALTITTIMAAILVASFFLVFFAVNRSLQPIKTLTAISSRLADGDLNQKIEVKTKDEIGKLADVLERLRFSLKAAMERLARKAS